MDNFAVFILTHRRPDRQLTLQTLRKQGYTGAVYLVVDDEDETLPDYLARYDNVLVFNKPNIHEQLNIDRMLPTNNYAGVVFARNVVWRLAKQLGLSAFVTLDDDFTSFVWYVDHNLRALSAQPKVRNLDRLFEIAIEFVKQTPTLHFSFSSTANYLGGIKSKHLADVHLERKTMAVFFCLTSRPHRFYGAINEDTNTYLSYGKRGGPVFLSPFMAQQSKPTMSQSGGLTETYKATGAYQRAFLTVMMRPDAVRLVLMNAATGRLRHNTNWASITPVILHERWRKSTTPYRLPQVQNDDLPDEYLQLTEANNG